LYDHDEPVFADPPLNPAPAAFGASGPVDTRPRRRLDSLTRTRDAATAVRVVPGQLPTFERHYLMSELRRIIIISSVLMGAIIALTLLLR
jgi:hypothetical protein